MLRFTHFYHIYCGTEWREIVHEHLNALEDSGLSQRITQLHVGIVGAPAERAEALEMCDERISTKLVAEADEGHEQVTLRRLYANVGFLWDAVLYAHTKGVSRPHQDCEFWRRTMTRNLIGGWEYCVQMLEQGHESVGCYWLTSRSHPGLIETPIYGGNFWWARSELIRRAGRPSEDSRMEAEAWIGRANPRNPVNLVPGWPETGPDRPFEQRPGIAR